MKTLFQFSIFLFFVKLLMFFYFTVLRLMDFLTYEYLDSRDRDVFTYWLPILFILNIVYLSISWWSHPPSATQCCSQGIVSWPLRMGSWGWGDGWPHRRRGTCPRLESWRYRCRRRIEKGGTRHCCGWRQSSGIRREKPRSVSADSSAT